jgi:hypothetical protein
LFRLRYTLTGLLALIGVIAATLASLRQLGFFDEDLGRVIAFDERVE